MLKHSLNRKKLEKTLFSLGSVALAAAVLSITIAPYIVNHFMTGTYIPILHFRVFSGIFYFAALICYLFSTEHSNMQINWILITFAYFVAFQVLAKIMS